MKRNLQRGFACCLLAASLFLLAWGFWPPRRETVTTLLTLPAGVPSLPGTRMIRLTFSPRMRAGDSQIMELNVTAEGEMEESDVYETYNVIAEARLDLAPSDVRPAELLSAALVRGSGATFYWEVTPREEGILRGTVWLYLRFIPKAGGEETRQPVYAPLVEVRSMSMLMQTGSEARLLGVVGFGIGVGFCVLLLWQDRAKVL